MVANTPVPSMVLLAAYLRLRGIPLVLWHQDVHGIAIQSFAGAKLGRAFRLVAGVIGRGERWVARRSAAVVVIADSFVDVHRAVGDRGEDHGDPELGAARRDRPDAPQQRVGAPSRASTAAEPVYSGTLGLKHNPALLVGLARQVRDAGVPVHLTVVNEGPAVDVLRDEAERLDVPITLLPFQPYERLPEVLGSGDVLVVLLDASAGAFSVPSKTLSYLCAGRPVLGLMPAENLAARWSRRSTAACCRRRGRAPRGRRLGRVACSRTPGAVTSWAAGEALAEREFALDGCATRSRRSSAGSRRGHGDASRYSGRLSTS